MRDHQGVWYGLFDGGYEALWGWHNPVKESAITRCRLYDQAESHLENRVGGVCEDHTKLHRVSVFVGLERCVRDELVLGIC